MNILLVPIGSHGDVHPLVGIGIALKARGHRVTVITNPHFEPLVRKVGLDFAGVGTNEQYHELAKHPDLWHPLRAVQVIFAEIVGPMIRPTFEAIAARHVPGETVLVGSSLAFGARVAQEVLNVPMATVHLQPVVLRTMYDSPRLPGVPLAAWMPRWIKRMMYEFGDVRVIDPRVTPELNKLRGEFGLPPVSRVMAEYWNAPQRVIGLWPEWWAPIQPDWPPQFRLTGFPLYDESDVTPLSPELEQFLAGGDPPVAFTPGSAMWQGHRFFAESAAACQRLGVRGLLLTRHLNHLPPKLPPGVIHVDYAPFSRLLPHCAAIVHHGGIGTTSQALAAGIPQLIMPMSHDQPDNARRIKHLGVGDSISVRRYRANRIAKYLASLLESKTITSRCNEISARIEPGKAIQQTCEIIERLKES